MKTNRLLIQEVEQAEERAGARADAARAEIIGREISTGTEGGKPMTETGEKTGEKTVGETGPRRRRRFTPEAPDTMPAEPVATSDSDSNWQDKDRAGYFAGRPGPGRGHTADASRPRCPGAWGEGDDGLDLLKEMVAAIERRGPRWFDELLKASPVTSAQLLAALRKTTPAPGTPGGGEVNINFGDGPLAGIAESILAPQVHDLDGLDADALRAEIGRLKMDNDRLQRAASGLPPVRVKEEYDPLMAETAHPSTECLDCLSHGYEGRMIKHFGKCDKCGQLASDNEAGRLTVNTRAVAEPEEPLNAAAFSIGEPARGWRQVADLSTEGIRSALGTREPDRGVF